jgi:hypothetical protein
MYVSMTLLKRFVSDDGQSQVDILKRDDGLFTFRESQEQVIEDPCGREDSTYWAPSLYAGIYESLEAVEEAARQMVPWLSRNP